MWFLSLAILGISAFHTLYSATHNQMFTVQETRNISIFSYYICVWVNVLPGDGDGGGDTVIQ